MHQDSIVLNTKLQPPRVSDIIHREQFSSLVSQFKDKQLITVTAGAGYGKTTFVIDALNRLNAKLIWYRMDKSDADFITFIQYISTGVKKIYPGFGDEIFSLLKDPECSERKKEFFITLFINDLERCIDEELFFVLDDFHLVQDGQEARDATEFLLNHLPNKIHLILISRSAITLPLSRLKSMRGLLEINENDLCFNKTEIKKLFSEVFDISINESMLKKIFKKTSGWISGLILFYHMLKGKREDEVEIYLKTLKGSGVEINTYLEENIFNQLPSDVQSFLIRTSILPRLNSGVCNQFLGLTNSKDILRYLEKNHFFTFLLDEGDGYVYHDLLKDFLEEKLKTQMNEKEVKDLHSRIANIYEKMGDNRVALDHYVKAGRMEDASRLIGMFAFLWVFQGQVRQIELFLEDIPESYRKKYPWFLYLQAGLFDLSGKPEESILDYTNALEAFRGRSLDGGEDMCLMELAISYFKLGDYEKAGPLFKEIIDRNTFPAYLKIINLGFLIALSSALGKMSDSENYIDKAMAMLPEITEEYQFRETRAWIFTAISWKLLIQGMLVDALKYVKDALSDLYNTDASRSIVLCYIIMSSIYHELGQYDEGVRSAKEALDVANKKGFKEVLFPLGYYMLGSNCLELGLLDEALRKAKKCLDISRKIKNFYNQAWAYILFSNIYSYSGNLEAAEKNVLQGMKALEHLNAPFVQGILEFNLASIKTKKGKFTEARELLASVENKGQHFYRFKALAYFGYARCYYLNNQRGQAVDTFLKGVSVCEQYGFDGQFVFQQDWTVPLLLNIFVKGEKKDYIRKVLKKMGPEAVNALSSIIGGNPQPLIKNAATGLFNELRREFATGLKINYFGKFKLFMGETELPVNKWKSKKALHLFKYLIYSRHRGYLSKEVLMELLWPDEDPAKSSNRFHVLLASMRKDLEPNLAKGVPSAYILSNNGAYMLDIGNDGWVDIEEFTNEIKHAKTSKDPEESMNHYLNAISLYRGDFLEEDLYIDWCSDIREKYKEDYLYALKEVIKFYEQQKEFDKCIDYASIYLKTEKCAEEIYQVLMRCHSNLSNTAMVVKTFEKCKKTIQNELDCPLSQETLDLYQELNPN